MALITDPDLLEDSAADDASQEVYIDTTAKTIKLNIVGNLSNDGATLKALYSFLKEEWRNDPHTKNLAAFDFPMVPITDESFEFVAGWDLFNDASRNLIRTAGWTVRNVAGNATQMWAGIIGLGSIESNDQLYFQQVSGGAAVNVQLTGQINQAVQIYKDDDGDGNLGEGSDFDRRSFFRLFVREESQAYDIATLADIGVTQMAAIAYRFPIGTGTDLKIAASDATVAANEPYTKIVLRYFDQPFSRDVDSGADRNFGIVIDCGTHSGVDGAATAAGVALTSAEGGIVGADFIGGTVKIHEGANAGTYNILGTPTATVVTITGATFPSTVTNQSFTLYPATALGATAEQIYTKVQYQLRQNSDVDTTDQTVVGKVADQLLEFVGDTLHVGRYKSSKYPANPNGGGTGVFIEGFASADTNRLNFYDNISTARTFPYVATLTINFGTNLQNDASAQYWIYFTTLPGAGNDFGESGAILVETAAAADMAGGVSGQPSVTLTFDYDNNAQGGRTPGTDAPFTAIGIGLAAGQHVKATGTIQRSTSNSVSLVAPLERNYTNP